MTLAVKIYGAFTREQLKTWLDVAEREIEIEHWRQRLKKRIAARERQERAHEPVVDRCRCGDPDVIPPCSYCERGGDEASLDRD